MSAQPLTRIELNLPRKIAEAINQPARTRIFYGGRGGAKSVSIAQYLVAEACATRERILCAREFQASIADSVHSVLAEQIEFLNLGYYYQVNEKTIRSYSGSEFIFKGLRRNINSVKSIQGIKKCWVEEAQTVSTDSIQKLEPSIRAHGSEIWYSFNPEHETDPVYQMVLNPPPNTVLCNINYDDNPWFADPLLSLMEYDRRVSPDKYEHVWRGGLKRLSNLIIFSGKYVIESFETPPDVDFYFGADWGFAQDPTVLIRCFIVGCVLYIDHEVYKVGCEINHTPRLFDKIPGAHDWPIRADSARPETISYVRRGSPATDEFPEVRPYTILSVKKWDGSVEDGIEFMKSFERIVVHERCKSIAAEFATYSYKADVDGVTPLPKVEDKNNHGVDSCRYALSELIQRSKMGIFDFYRARSADIERARTEAEAVG